MLDQGPGPGQGQGPGPPDQITSKPNTINDGSNSEKNFIMMMRMTTIIIILFSFYRLNSP